MLHRLRHGAATARPTLLIAHGLFGSARNWGAVARRLAADREVVAVDMRNHGESPREAVHDYPGMAADLAAVIEAEGPPLDVMGHSMGGKAAMWLALTRGALVRRLAVLDISPVAYTHTNQAHIDAMRRVDLAAVASRKEAEAQMGGDPAIAPFLLQSLDLPARRWRLDLDALEAAMGTVSGFPAGGTPFERPALFLSGEDSDYVLPSHRDEVLALFPRARFARLKGAGHWLHVDRPREVEGAVRAFLDRPD